MTTDMSQITVRRLNSQGIAYGEPIHGDDLRWEVKEEIHDAIRSGEQSGEVEVGGQTYQWERQ